MDAGVRRWAEGVESFSRRREEGLRRPGWIGLILGCLFGALGSVPAPEARALDENEDGISDVIQLGMPPGFVLDPSSDFDGDGLSDLAEALLRSNPWEPGDAVQPTLDGSAVGVVTLRWRTQPHLVYTVDESFDLRTWSTVGQVVGEGGIGEFMAEFPKKQLLPDGTFGLVAAPAFWRLRVDPAQQPDEDEDFLDAWEEMRLGTDPKCDDTDGDSIRDGDEVYHGLNPLVHDGDREPPTAPTQLSYTSMDDAALVTWAPSTDNLKLAYYQVFLDGEMQEGPAAWDPLQFLVPTSEERAITVQVQAFDVAGNRSPLSEPLVVRGKPTDRDRDGLPDRWEYRHFQGDALANEDPDEDGLDNLAEFLGGTDPNDFYNGVPVRSERIGPAQPGPDGLIRGRVLKPDGTPWPHARVLLFSQEWDPPLSAEYGKGPYSRKLRVWADENGEFKAYVGWPR